MPPALAPLEDEAARALLQETRDQAGRGNVQEGPDAGLLKVDSLVRPAAGGRYLIGLEFLTVPTTVLASIEQLGMDAQIEVIDSEASRS